MAESIQHKLDRVRRPRVQITYDVEIGDAIEKRELPFVVGVIADLSGNRDEELPNLRDRKFVEVDRDNLMDIMAVIHPRITMSVRDMVNKSDNPDEDKRISVELRFKSIDDFEPQNVARNAECVSDIFVLRNNLRDVLAKLDGNDKLEKLLNDVMNKQDVRDKLSSEISETQNNSVNEDKLLSQIINDGKMARYESHIEHALKILSSLVETINKDVETNGDIKHKTILVYLMSKVAGLDTTLTDQINEIMHDEGFQRLEATWRGLSYLVMNSETSTRLKIRLLNASLKELQDDLNKAIEFDQSALFKKIYEEEYGTFGGAPFSCLIGDYYMRNHPQDIKFLEMFAGVAAAAHAPFITGVLPSFFNIDNFESLPLPRDLAKTFESTDYVKWRSFRDTEDSRYVSLVLPRMLLRLPYGPDTVPVAEFDFKEYSETGDTSKFCWGNAVYALGQRITNAFALYGWTAAIRGVEGGGKVEGLPAYVFKTNDGDKVIKCPTEVIITDRREKELNDLGFISICYCKGTDFGAFFGTQTTQKPKVYNKDEATANAALSARLTYLMSASRFAHYVKVICRDKVGSFLTKENLEQYLNTWISEYVLLNDTSPQEIKAAYPLREARIDVYDVPGKPGAYSSIIYLRPHFQMEELTASIRLVANLPAK